MGKIMTVLVDGVEVEVFNDVRVIYHVENAEGGEGQLQVVANHEGLVYDLFDKTGEELVETSYDFVTDIVERLEGQ